VKPRHTAPQAIVMKRNGNKLPAGLGAANRFFEIRNALVDLLHARKTMCRCWSTAATRSATSSRWTASTSMARAPAVLPRG